MSSSLRGSSTWSILFIVLGCAAGTLLLHGSVPGAVLGVGPTFSDPLTITNPYAMWIDAGNARFDGDIQATSGSLTALNVSSG